MFPFKQYVKNGFIIREFDDKTPSDEFVWHRDRADRNIRVIEAGIGWKYQEEDSVPIELNSSHYFSIKKNTYHRVIKGHGKLIVAIEEL